MADRDLALGRTQSRRRLEQPAQLVRAQTGIAKYSRQRPALQLPMKRDGEQDAPIRMLQSNVASSLASDFPSVAFERFDQTLSRYDWQGGGHAGTGNFRRITPVSSERPSSRIPST